MENLFWVLLFCCLFVCLFVFASSSLWRLPTFLRSQPSSILRASSVVTSYISLTLAPDSTSLFHLQRTFMITLDPPGQPSILPPSQAQLTSNLNFICSLTSPLPCKLGSGALDVDIWVEEGPIILLTILCHRVILRIQ